MNKQEILFDGDKFTHDGRTFHVTIEHDDRGAPWVENDGHGPVTGWLTRDKKPGERVLHSDRESKRFYDFAEATRIAKRDDWGLSEDGIAALIQSKEYRWRNAHNKNRMARLPELCGPMKRPTRGEITAQSVENDFEYLRAWCNDDWHYVGVCVRHESQDESDKYSYALWGIESDCEEYITQTAHQLAEECAHALDAEIAENRQALKTNRRQFSALAMDSRNSAALAPTICEAVKSKLQSLIADRAQVMARIAELSV